MKSIYQEYYEKNQDYKMDLYAYSPPGNGTFHFDGIKYHCGKDFRTVEHYQTYKDCGFNAVLGQTSSQYAGEYWETAQAKADMDRYQKIGIKKFILLDNRIYDLSRTPDGLIGEGKKFANEKELDEYVVDCLSPYREHPIFYGLQLRDEPGYEFFKSIGQVYRSIKRVRPETFVQCNLHPPFFIFRSKMFPGDGDFWTRYKRYICTFLDETGADYFQYDFYPFISEEATSIYQMYFRGLRVSAEIAQERDVKFYMVAQSFQYRVNCGPCFRTISREDMFWQINALLGYGVRQFSYFTYWSKSDNNIKGEYFPDGLAIMTRMGEKTPLYDYVQEVNGHLQRLAPLLKDFEYVSDDYNARWPCISRPMYLMVWENKPLNKVTFFRPDREVVTISELYDKNKDRYLYRVLNCADPYYGKESGEQTTEIVFDKKFRYADVYKDGEWETVELQEGKYTAKLLPGFAEYVLLH